MSRGAASPPRPADRRRSGASKRSHNEGWGGFAMRPMGEAGMGEVRKESGWGGVLYCIVMEREGNGTDDVVL